MEARDRLEAALHAVVQRVAEASGVLLDVSDRTCPMSEIPNFDSLIAEEATMFLEDDLGITIEEQVFHRDGRMLTFAESLHLLKELTKGRIYL